MEGSFKTNRRYRLLRDAFLEDNEGFNRKVYFDTVGIPTISKGVALLARADTKSKKDSKRSFELHEKNIEAIKKVLGADSHLAKSIESMAIEALKAINHTPEPDYPKVKGKISRKLSFFQTTQRGKQLVQLLGPLTGRWETSGSPTITQTQAEEIYAEVIDQREVTLNGYLKTNNIDHSQLGEEQRIALVDTVYHGRWGKRAIQAAKAMIDGKSIEEICQYLQNSQYPGRTQKLAQLLKKTWQPTRSNKRIPPSRSIKEPGISAEQLSILREYLLSQSLSQPIGRTAYEQVLGRYMGAGSDVPLKNPCDPYGDVERRYGD